MIIDSERILKFSEIALLVSIIVFNVLNFLDKLTTYFGMRMGFIEMNDIASNLFSEYGLLSGILIQFFVAMVGSIAIYFVLVKSLKFLAVHIPIILGYAYITINYLLAVASNVYYLVRY